MVNYEHLIKKIIDTPQDQLTLDFVKQVKRAFSKQNKLKNIVSNVKILREYHRLVKE